jgi:adenylate cyclase
VPIIISTATRARTPQFAAVPLGAFVVKGRTDATEIFALVGDEATARSKAFQRLHDNFAAGVAAFSEGRKEDALRNFEACRQGETFGLDGAIDFFLEEIRAG